jgi:hypothetical protein
MFEILTPLIKATRVSRKIDESNFVAVPGIWAVVKSGALDNVTTSTPELINKLVIGNSSSNEYEGHDVEVGRITTLETPGVRCRADSDVCVMTGMAMGADLVVSTEAGSEGKLAVTSQVTPGTYEVVARVQGIDAVNGIVEYVTVDPFTTVISAPVTTA